MKPIKCFALPIDDVLAHYKNAGFNVELDDEIVPNVLQIDGAEWFFTGDALMVDGVCHEIVIVAEWFSFEDVENLDEDEDE
jgi:hypothetical protein